MFHGQRFNAYSHLTGLVLAIVAASWLLPALEPHAGIWQFIGGIIFASSVILLYAASTLAHSLRGARRCLWERIDHCAIFILIGGTYTPFALHDPTAASVAVLAAIWALCAVGLKRELRSPTDARPPLAIYLGLGWICVADVSLGSHQGPPEATALLLAGAAAYSLGTIFYRNAQGYRHAHGVWHLFVLAGTTAHYFAVGSLVGQ